jgi:5-amino-6-(5-phospho-D-ribitylamino)uracil phosphatase
MNKGLICLDIDGTITSDKYSIPEIVLKYLEKRHKQGWKIALLTGRSYVFSKKILSQFSYDFYFSTQNGANVLKMPQKENLYENYLLNETLEILKKNIDLKDQAVVIYASLEDGGDCYFLKDHLSLDKKDYVDELFRRQGTKSFALKKLTDFKNEKFPLIKFIGTFADISSINEKVLKLEKFQTVVIKDPFDTRFYVLMISNKNCSKGTAVKFLKENCLNGGKIICAGNDKNDFSMFEYSDVKIAMPSSPDEMIESADIISPSVEENGIMHALDQAIL